ncbi:replication initiation protein [Vibrio sagamiensis]|uniref:Initiator Rep protein WH1 domain-containing protein n=1 Tax=Vibrio sagamiensis NBRC 104589 TaxID=1219064 RepID=A0A511QIR6_9VIBR|nr:replication initiation protein [Vibrio sagamiensis]GEM77215.1 hypothetical protein VSA01S_33270 [Vibrio sagamiensis NBRC 104589]
MKKEEGKSVTKPHDAIIAKFRMSAREQDLVTLAFMEVKKFADKSKVVKGQFDPSIPETLESLPTIFYFTQEKVAKLLNVSVKSLNLMDKKTGKTFLHSVCDRLVGRKAEISTQAGDFLVANLISEAEFNNGKLRLEVTRSQAARMLDYGLNKNNFGIIDAKLVLGFKSAYTKRIFEIISRFKNTRDYTTSVGELCAMLGTSLDEHADFSRFRRNCLDRPLAQIVKDSDGVWEYKNQKGYVLETRQGKKATNETKITFKMKHNEKLSTAKADLASPMDYFLEQYRLVVDYVFEDIPLSNNALDTYQLALTEVMKQGELPSVVGGFGGAMELYAKAKSKMIA